MSVGDWLDLMAATVVITPFSAAVGSSAGSYGGPNYTGTASTYRGRVRGVSERTINTQGEDVVPSHKAWLATTAAITVQAKCSIDGTTYRILRVDRPTDQLGVHHTELWLRG